MSSTGGRVTAASTSDSRLLAGQLIGGKYRVSYLLGEGGMASVWAGSNERTGKLVALKVIRQSFTATPGADAFLRSEGLAASRVNHPNVVTVFDLIEHEGIACIVMEFLEGIHLGTYIARNKPLSLRDAAGILFPAMRGVAAAHVQGVIHRDLKPQNIFVCLDVDGSVVTTKVLDFGISMMVDWARGRTMAKLPWQVGTPSYMAPEHIEGLTTLDPRTDVYGFGLLLYETLSATPAFPAAPVVSDVLNRVLYESAVPLRDLRPDLPVGIYSIVEKALAKRLGDRFESLNQMMMAIEGEIAQPTLTGPGSTAVPSALMNYTVSGPLSVGVPSYVERESSEQYATRSYTQFRREGETSAPAQKVSNEPSQRMLMPIRTPASGIAIRTPATGIAAYRVGSTPPPVNPTITVRIAYDTYLRALKDLLHRLQAYPRVKVLVPPAVALMIALVVWGIGRSPHGPRPDRPRPAAPSPSEAVPLSPPAPPVPSGQPPLPLPREETPPAARTVEPHQVLPSEKRPPSPLLMPVQHGRKSSKARSVAERGHGSKGTDEGRGVPDAGATGKAASAPSTQATRRAGALNVDDF